jgi:hypothetical protein
MISRWPGNDEGMPRGPVKSARYAKGLANRDGCPYHVASGGLRELSGDEYVDTGSPGKPGAGYSPMGARILHEDPKKTQRYASAPLGKHCFRIEQGQ